jgi:hypothetical protein
MKGLQIFSEIYRIKTKFLMELFAFFRCIHLISLNIRHFGMVAARELKHISSRSPSVASPACQMHDSPPVVSKTTGGKTVAQTGWRAYKLPFISKSE